VIHQVIANTNVGSTCRVKFKVMDYVQPPDDWDDHSPPSPSPVIYDVHFRIHIATCSIVNNWTR
jgi:hypothetical protein